MENKTYLRLSTGLYGIQIRADNFPITLEEQNPHLLAKYKYLYILTDQDIEPLKNAGTLLKLQSFIESDILTAVYVPMTVCDHRTMPYHNDGWIRGRQAGLVEYAYKNLKDYILQNIPNDYYLLNCLLTDEENLFN